MNQSNNEISRRSFLKLGGLGIVNTLFPQKLFNFILDHQKDITPEEIEFLQRHEVSLGDTSRKVLLMTYDDGGKPSDIASILNFYKESKGKTTFFVTGEWLVRDTNWQTAKRIVSEGHVLGCHGYYHQPFTSLSSKNINEQLNQFIMIAEQVVPGYNVRFFRPPYGDRNLRVIKEAAKLGLQTIIWSLGSGGQDPLTYQRVLDGVKNGTIVLSHSTRYYDITQTPKIAAGVTNAGFSLESLETGLDPKDNWEKQKPIVP